MSFSQADSKIKILQQVIHYQEKLVKGAKELVREEEEDKQGCDFRQHFEGGAAPEPERELWTGNTDSGSGPELSGPEAREPGCHPFWSAMPTGGASCGYGVRAGI